MKIILLIIFGIFAFCSCSKNLETTPEINNIQKDYTIPIEDALSSLEDFMGKRGIVMTKGGVSDYIDNYFTVSTPATKTSSTMENILYAVNFKDEGGYALLSADTRIQEDILAVTDQGSITEEDFNETTFEKIPTDNDDLLESDYDAMVESGVLAITDKQINIECLEYARSQIDDCEDNDSDDDASNDSGSDTVTYSWKTIEQVPRMMNTAWTQSTANDDIFNKYCPEVGLIWKSKAPAGCVCIALSQIIAFHEYPGNLTYNGMQISYPDIKKIYYYNNGLYGYGDDISRDMLARFCIKVGDWCNTKYHSIFKKSWGFAWPSDAKSCLEKFGYKNVSLNWSYNESQVLESLDNDCPVFMSAISGLIAGHAWVIDGYIKRDYISSTGNVSKSQTLVHCNWGWAGNCNGYFTSGVFHTKNAEIKDAGFSSSKDKKYWYAFNTIMYEKPQN
jgi:hypothetical protein